MKKVFVITWSLLLTSVIGLAACSPVETSNKNQSGMGDMKVLAAESFLADIAQNVAGDRLNVDTLIPAGMDPHAFEPVPKDVVKISECNVLIVNGSGLESWLQNIIQSAGGDHLVVEASQGLISRDTNPENHVDASSANTSDSGHKHETDPHFWLDPVNAIHYVENIRDGFIKIDPTGKEIYTQNARNYISKLEDLDRSIQQQISIIPQENRVIVTNHESFGYFADRYHFKIVGTIIPSVSTGASPSARQMSQLIDQIKAAKVLAIFLETGSNTQLADQISSETGVKVVTDLYTHSTTAPEGEAPTYIDMIQVNVKKLVNALK